HLQRTAFQHFHNGRFTATALVDTALPHQHTIAVETATHLPRAEEQVVTAVIGLQKAETIAVANDHAGDQVHLVGDAISIAAVEHQLAVPLHRLEAAAQGFHL